MPFFSVASFPASEFYKTNPALLRSLKLVKLAYEKVLRSFSVLELIHI